MSAEHLEQQVEDFVESADQTGDSGVADEVTTAEPVDEAEKSTKESVVEKSEEESITAEKAADESVASSGVAESVAEEPVVETQAENENAISQAEPVMIETAQESSEEEKVVQEKATTPYNRCSCDQDDIKVNTIFYSL